MLSRSELTTGHGRAAEMVVARARHALQGAEPLISTASATWYEEDERDLLPVRVFGIVFLSNASLSKDRDNKTQWWSVNWGVISFGPDSPPRVANHQILHALGRHVAASPYLASPT
jgi:hypothetical protein